MPTHERLATRAVLLTADLIRARDAYRSLLGERYTEKIGPCRRALRQVMEARGLSALEAALPVIKAAQEHGEDTAALQLIAAAVDVAEGNADLDAPSHAPLHAPSDGAFEP